MRRTLLDVKNAAHRRLLVAGHVAVPAFPIRTRAVLVGVDFHQGGQPGLVWSRGMDVQLAEMASKGQVLFRRELLTSEEDYQVFHQSPVDLVEEPVTEWLR